MRRAVLYVLCVVVLATVGLGSRWGLSARRQEAGLTASHAIEVESLLARMPAAAGHGGGHARGAGTSGSIGAAVEEAAVKGGLRPNDVLEVKPANATEGNEGLLTVYRVRLAGVRPEGLVKFVYLMESAGHLRTTELTLERKTLRNPEWDATMLVVRAL